MQHMCMHVCTHMATQSTCNLCTYNMHTHLCTHGFVLRAQHTQHMWAEMPAPGMTLLCLRPYITLAGGGTRKCTVQGEGACSAHFFS